MNICRLKLAIFPPISGMGDRNKQAGAVHLPGVEVSSHRLPSAGELQHGLDGDEVDVIGVSRPAHARQVHQAVGETHGGVLDELQLPINWRRGDSIPKPFSGNGLQSNVLPFLHTL